MYKNAKEIPQYVGRFRVKKNLTLKLNYGDWVIYRDPEVGIYLYSPHYDDEVNPMFYNITENTWSDRVRDCLISSIEENMDEIVKNYEICKKFEENPEEFQKVLKFFYKD